MVLMASPRPPIEAPWLAGVAQLPDDLAAELDSD
jgi:hypothetical protein